MNVLFYIVMMIYSLIASGVFLVRGDYERAGTWAAAFPLFYIGFSSAWYFAGDYVNKKQVEWLSEFIFSIL